MKHFVLLNRKKSILNYLAIFSCCFFTYGFHEYFSIKLIPLKSIEVPYHRYRTEVLFDLFLKYIFIKLNSYFKSLNRVSDHLPDL